MRLWTLLNKLRVREGRMLGGLGNWATAIKEGTRRPCVSYATNEFLNTTSKTKDGSICWLIEHKKK